MADNLTAAEHFHKAEYLLEAAEAHYGEPKTAEWVARAQAHLAAARLLLYMHELAFTKLNGPNILAAAGLGTTETERRTDRGEQ